MSEQQTPVSPEKEAAEIEKIRAEAEKARAEALAATVAAAKAEVERSFAQVQADAAWRKEKAELAKDDHHKVYRFGEPVSAASVTKCIAELTRWSRQEPECNIEVVFTSPGGSIIDGFVLFDFLRQLSRSGHSVTTGCLGWAASMAGILLQAGDHRWVGAEGWIMIHRAAFGASGKTFDIEDEVEWVKRIEDRIVKIFVERTGGKLTDRKIKANWSRKDWWIDSGEALAFGLVDEVR